MQQIILFDGSCNLCSAAVQFILRRDKVRQFQFVSLQSDEGKRLLQQYTIGSSPSPPLPAANNHFDTLIYIRQNKVFIKSTAVVHVLSDLGGSWKICYALLVIPKFLRDALYSLIAKNRHRLFRKKTSCELHSH